MNRNAKMKRIAAILLTVIMALQINPMGAENDPSGWNTYYSDWWRPLFETESSEYTFSGVGDTILLPYLLGLNGIYGIITDASTDSDALRLDGNLYLTALDYFDSAELSVTAGGKTFAFILHNPGPETVIPAGEEVAGENGSFTAASEIPAGTQLALGAYEPTEAQRAAIPENGEDAYTVWMEIGLVSPDGEAVHAGADVTVKTNIELPPVPEEYGLIGRAAVKDAKLYHVVSDTEVEELPVEVETEDGVITTLRFSTESFSGFALSYTVDFEFIVNGQAYEYTLPGGGFIPLRQLAEALGLVPADDPTGLELLINGIQNVAFSDPDLVWVGKTENDTTLGMVKDAYGLACDYSAELTEEEIAQLNDTAIPSGEWILISLKPFTSEEALTVTMQNGDVWTVEVTDWQIQRDYLSADGITYRIEVTLDDRDIIEGEAELSVEELLEGTEKYENYLYAVSESMMLDSIDEIQFVRFFDIKVLVDGEIFEPEYPAQVKISYQDPIELGDNQAVNIVHFADAGVEIIQAVEVSGDRRELKYEQTGFSVTATVVAANNLQDGHEYIIYTRSNNRSYAMTHYSEGRDKDTVYSVEISAGNAAGTAVSIANYGSSIVWTAHRVTVSGTTYWTFSYEEDGKTYYLRTYGGLMVGADSDINESQYTDSSRYQWRIDSSNRLRARYNQNNNTRYLRYSNDFKERSGNNASFYFADVSSYTIDVPPTPTIHYVDENGNELTVVNGRDWTTDSSTSPAYLIYDIDGYEYVKTTLKTISGTVIRPMLRVGKWQYTTSTGNSITWTDIPADDVESNKLEDIYVVYKKAAEPVYGGTPKVKQVQGKEPDPPVITKSSAVNGDGTNTLSLSVTGHTEPMEVEKLADVIVIVDTSSSMRRHMGTATDTYESNSTLVKNYRDHETRMWIAAEAVNNLADTLIGEDTEFKNSQGENLIRMSLISFNSDASLKCGFTDDYTTFTNAVGNLTTNTGTNWEAALELANHLRVDPERATFVIFVTDGNPSYRTSRGNLLELEGYPETVNDANLDLYASNDYYSYRVNQYFGPLDETEPRNYNTAVVTAQSIVSHRKNLYSIGIGNSAGITRLQGLTAEAYNSSATGAAHTKTADNPEELALAFSDITASIAALMGHSDVQITDGISDLTQTVQKSSLVSFAEDDFTYYKGHEATAEDVANGLAAAVGDMVWVSWDPTSEGCAEAVYNTTTGAVEWNMGEGFMLEEGYTYEVHFKVWPSQEAYDLLADLNNGKKSYSSLTDEEKAQIKEPTTPGGMYTLKTNSETSYTYRPATKTGETVTPTGEPSEPGSFPDVDPLELTTKPLKVQKLWHNNYVDSRTLTDSITMELYGVDSDGTTSHSFKEFTLTQEGNWYAENNYISYGLVTYDTATDTGAKIYEAGHDFTLRETDDEAHYYELTAGVFRPMFINGTPTILEQVESAPAGMSDSVFHYSDGSNDYYRLDGKIYQNTESDILLIATNTHRSYMDLNKVIVDLSGDPVTDNKEFEYKITLLTYQ